MTKDLFSIRELAEEADVTVGEIEEWLVAHGVQVLVAEGKRFVLLSTVSAEAHDDLFDDESEEDDDEDAA